MRLSIILSLYVFTAISQSMDVKVQNIEVIGHKEGSSLLDFIPSVVKLEGQELQRQRETSLGDTLSSQAGVSSTQFGPSASRPVIRGLDGARIRVLQNSLGTLDASVQSVDHAIAIDPLTLDSIEVVRGPMSLVYGSSAVGGVVNIVTNRVHNEFESGLHSSFLTQGESNNNGVSTGASMDYGINNYMFHLDASTRNLQDYEADSDEIENSYNKQNSLAFGISKIYDRGSLGVSYNSFLTNYGVVAEEDVTINMQQNRYELHADYKPYSIFSNIKFRSAHANYIHTEFEGDEVGTVYENKGSEARLEAFNSTKNRNGVSGLQFNDTSFNAVGDEAFLPAAKNQSIAAFTYQEFIKNKNTFSIGLRVENSNIEKEESANFGESQEADFTAYNSSLGYLRKLDSNKSLSANISYTERGPNFQELYSDGAHVATSIYERGNDNLGKEKAYAFELSFREEDKTGSFVANIYTQYFKDFIALSPTGNTDGPSSFDIFEYSAVDARFYGFDLERKEVLGEFKGGTFNSVSRLDYVVAKNTDTGEYLPRISPARVTLGVFFDKDNWNSDIQVTHAFEQTNTAENESNTDSYTLTDIGYAYNFFKQSYGVNLFARVKNIFDSKAINHVSVIKDVAPIAGRNFVLGSQIRF